MYAVHESSSLGRVYSRLLLSIGSTVSVLHLIVPYQPDAAFSQFNPIICTL